MIYLPALVIKVSRNVLKTSFEFGYLLSLVLAQGVGLWFQFHLVGHLRIKTALRMVIFGVVAIAGYDISFGVHGTNVRYVASLVSALTMRKAGERIIAGNGRWANVSLSAIAVQPQLGSRMRRFCDASLAALGGAGSGGFSPPSI